jgi:hypothetical protein
MNEALGDALAEIKAAHEEFSRRQARLRDVSGRLPSPEYDDESGAPTNLAAALKLGLDASVDEPLDGAVRWLARAVLWTETRFGDPVD